MKLPTKGFTLDYLCTQVPKLPFPPKKSNYKFTHLQSLTSNMGQIGSLGGHLPPNQAVEAKNVPIPRDSFMSRYYHVVVTIVSLMLSPMVKSVILKKPLILINRKEILNLRFKEQRSEIANLRNLRRSARGQMFLKILILKLGSIC